MSSSQDRAVLAATVVLEVSWLFPLAGVAALALGQEESPLGWLAMMTVLGLSLVVTRLSPSNVAAIEVVYLVRTLIGATVVYLTVGTQIAPDGVGVDLMWPVTALSGSGPEGYVLEALAGTLLGAALWWRGSRLASAEFPTEGLKLSFRVGLIGLAVAAVVDISNPADIHTFSMIFIFFASGLIGLSIGHVLPASKKSTKAGTWPKVIGGIVSAIILVGLGFGLLHGGILTSLSNPVLSAIGTAVAGAFWIVFLPIVFVFNGFVDWMIALFDRPYEPRPSGTGGLLVEEQARAAERAEETGEAFYMVIQIVEWVFLAVLALFILYLLVKALRRFLADGPRLTHGDRQSVKEDANPLMDIAKLMLKLIPDWMGKREGRRAFRLPAGPPGVVDVLRMYYDLLALAEDKGYQRRGSQTATEFQGSLERAFPANLVRAVTAAFNRACYGYYPATKEQIAQMRSSLTNIREAVAIVSGRGRGVRASRPRGPR